MDTSGIRAAVAAVTGARHLRSARNGQDAAVCWRGKAGHGWSGSLGLDEVETWSDGKRRGDAAAVVVCDGCSGGAGSEVGARLGAALFARVLGARLQAGGRPG